jgi:hypothetical protein
LEFKGSRRRVHKIKYLVLFVSLNIIISNPYKGGRSKGGLTALVKVWVFLFISVNIRPIILEAPILAVIIKNSPSISKGVLLKSVPVRLSYPDIKKAFLSIIGCRVTRPDYSSCRFSILARVVSGLGIDIIILASSAEVSEPPSIIIGTRSVGRGIVISLATRFFGVGLLRVL